MRDFVSRADYLLIVEDIVNGFLETRGAVEFLNDALYTAVLFDDILPSVDLVRPLFNSGQDLQTQLVGSSPFLVAVRGLNSHVLSRSPFATIDDYLSDTTDPADPPIKVPEEWAELSAQTGTIISPSNID